MYEHRACPPLLSFLSMNTKQSHDALFEINMRIGEAETKGDAEAQKWLRGLIVEGKLSKDAQPGPLLAFRRADGVCVGAEAFLQGVEKGSARLTEIEEIRLLGPLRALVTCVVTRDGIRYHNVRLFIRADVMTQDWKLLAWANERV